eukprot:TRINITY_DN13162_c1_g2_i1.p1 TRINITY_DN13162_c1_g2~~TRINITY_DN13162_c1_g2_i1.p1  ORF type:complete len:352 (-),score=80.87 TRINITY_DN13162_c1_g2_i1:149-1204(-)
MATSVFFRPYSRIHPFGFRPDSDISAKEPTFSGVSFARNLVSGQLLSLWSRDCNFSVRPRSFSDMGNLQYYVSPRSDGKKKEKSSEEVVMKKKKKKLIKGLSRKLLQFSEIDFGEETGEGLIGEVRGKIISEAASVLLAQLEKLREEEKEKKRKQREKKALKTAAWISYSPESSDSECEEIFTANHSGSGALAKTHNHINESQTQVEAPLTDPDLSSQGLQKTKDLINNCNSSTTCTQGCNNSCNGYNSLLGESTKKIKVCMGGTCKKSGAVELLEELEKMVGTEGAVVGCKCMGKCKKGPNVRVLNKKGEGSAGPRTGSLCTGVGLKDVGAIVADFLENAKEDDMGLLAA